MVLNGVFLVQYYKNQSSMIQKSVDENFILIFMMEVFIIQPPVIQRNFVIYLNFRKFSVQSTFTAFFCVI